ncbi:MAG TPA: DNA polymerase IV [Polyangiaceae bacterium]|nr:DNA polymerase IV [Polyangiaceae bacterium]
MSHRWILHADMDAFFASVEQRDHPEYRGKPVIVGASSARGVVSAASYEARQFGVRSAMPGFRAHELCPHGIFVAGDMKKYAAVSRQVHEVFREFTDQIEPLALDEAFLDITGSVKLLGSPEVIGRRLKDRVREATQLAVSVGIAPNKLVAKIACSRGKPDGLLLIRSEGIRALLDPLPVRALFGIGPKAEQRLVTRGITTLGELVRTSEAELRAALGEHAEDLRARARGEDERPVESSRAPKSIGEESTFSEDVRDERVILDALTAHAEAVASRARRAGFTGRTVTLRVKLAQKNRVAPGQQQSPHELFPSLTRQSRLPRPSADGAEIASAAHALWKKLALGQAVRLVGVSLSSLLREDEGAQLDLFAARPRPVAHETTLAAIKDPGGLTRGERLGRTLDAIADRFGSGKVRRAVATLEKQTASDKKKLGDPD